MPSKLAHLAQLTCNDTEWKSVHLMCTRSSAGGNRRSIPSVKSCNNLFYIVCGGCTWRLLPYDFQPRQIVYRVFGGWRQGETWQVMHDLIRGSMGIIDG
jgi:putative transposase